MKNMRSWFIWCGDGAEMRNLTKADAISMAESMAETHDRMPVIVSQNEVRAYLTDLAAAEEILSSASPELVRRGA